MALSLLVLLPALPSPIGASPVPPLPIPTAASPVPVLPRDEPAPSSLLGHTITLALHNASVLDHIGRGFFGIDVTPYAGIGPTVASYLKSSDLRFARWPGGRVADMFNYTTNRIYRPGGGSYVAPFTTAGFVAWCKSVRCVAEMQLPGEIDSPSTAAYYVRYVVHNLSFQPAYWEIGNEPALWNRYNDSWSTWATSPRSKVTPLEYAELVHRYIAAIRAVDPAAKFLGLPGVGTGAYREPFWIRETVSVNRRELSGVGIHVYPAGPTGARNATLEGFFSTLNKTGSLSHRLPLDHAAILSACPKCHSVGVYVDEMGAGSGGGKGPKATMMAGFPEVPYVTAEAIEGMTIGARSLDLYSLISSYPGSIFNGSTGAPHPVATLFSTIFPQFDPYVLRTQVGGTPGGLYLAASRDALGTSFSILVANTNTTTPVTLPLRGTGVTVLGFGAEWTWGPSSSGPVTKTWTGLTPSSFSVPAEGVVLVKVALLPSLL